MYIVTSFFERYKSAYTHSPAGQPWECNKTGSAYFPTYALAWRAVRAYLLDACGFIAQDESENGPVDSWDNNDRFAYNDYQAHHDGENIRIEQVAPSTAPAVAPVDELN